MAEGADAELVLLPVRAGCGGCWRAWECDELPSVCPACGSVDIELVGGDELVLESIEYRDG